MKILVAITNFGWKNMVYLKKLIEEYQAMSYDVDIVVFSNVPKDLGPNIEVRVGLPIKDPWSLGFPHKKMFAERVKLYDLFIYSEDDTLIKEHNIEAFLNLSNILPENEIAGFLRYEEVDFKRNFCEFHRHYHWHINSVKSIGDYAFAFFTNEHSACYILTQKQLIAAIESGGYLVEPHKGRYDLLCSAATDPYTQCGLTKMVCISHIEDFLLHHLPNVYIGRLGIDWNEFKLQIKALLAIEAGTYTRTVLINEPADAKFQTCQGEAQYYEKCDEDVLALIPDHTKTVLSIGCGWGETEAALANKGIKVVGIPLDAAIAELAMYKGIKVIEPDLQKAKESLSNKEFDCMLCVNILQHMQNPDEVLKDYSEFLREGGVVIVKVPNFDFIRNHSEFLKQRFCKDKSEFSQRLPHLTKSKMVMKWFERADFSVTRRVFHVSCQNKLLSILPWELIRRYLSRTILFSAVKLKATTP